MRRLNPALKHHTIKCPDCHHRIIKLEGVWHHVYLRKCNCMCDSNVKRNRVN